MSHATRELDDDLGRGLQEVNRLYRLKTSSFHQAWQHYAASSLPKLEVLNRSSRLRGTEILHSARPVVKRAIDAAMKTASRGGTLPISRIVQGTWQLSGEHGPVDPKRASRIAEHADRQK